MSFFKEKNPINIKEFIITFSKLNIINILLIILIIFFLRKFIFTLLKICLLNLHFFFLNCKNNIFYLKVYFNINKGPHKLKSFFARNSIDVSTLFSFLYYLFKYYFLITFITVFFLEIVFNKFILVISVELIPYFGLYSFFYQFIAYVVYVLDTQYDKKLSNFFYARKKKLEKKDYNDSYLLYMYINNKLLK